MSRAPKVGGVRSSHLVARHVGRRIAEFRVRQRLTQEQLAEAARVSTRYLQSVEAGGENLTIDSLVRFASLLGAEVVDLFKRPRAAKPGMRAGRKKKASRRRSGP